MFNFPVLYKAGIWSFCIVRKHILTALSHLKKLFLQESSADKW